MFSVICVYNDIAVLNRFLVESLKAQGVSYELIAVDNTGGAFKCAADALNYGSRRATGKYLMFAHQDVSLTSGDWLESAEKMMEKLPDAGIAGVAGRGRSGIRSIMTHGDPPGPVEGTALDTPEVVQTVDECILVVPRALFDRLPFDADTCNDWHLYGADYALAVCGRDRRCYVLPLHVYHHSSGTLNDSYYKTLGRLIKKYRRDYRAIYTTNGTWLTFIPVGVQRHILPGIVKYYRRALNRAKN